MEAIYVKNKLFVFLFTWLEIASIT